MARIIQGNPTWKAVIRCAQAGYIGKYNGVKGCFCVFEIEKEDLYKRVDYEGDVTIWCNCPSCGMVLYPMWQLISIPELPTTKG